MPVYPFIEMRLIFKCTFWLWLPLLLSAQEELPPWSIAVYMMPSDMIPEAIKDFQEMVTTAADSDLPIAVQWQTYDPDTEQRSVRRALLSGNESWYSSGTELPEGTRMPDEAVFADFLSWVKTVSPSQRRALVTWGHGGLERGLGYDGSSLLDTNYFTYDRMSAGAATANYTCDILVACGCKSAVTEGAIHYADFAHYFTGTVKDKIKLGSGLGPFNTWLADVAAHPEWEGARIGQSWVERYKESTGSYENTAIVMDLQAFTAPGAALDQAAWAAAALQRFHDVDTLRPLLHGIHANFQTSRGYTVLDDWLIALAADDNGLDPSIQSAAALARSEMEASITYRWYGANNANGLGFYTPYVENPPVSSPIPPESEYQILDRAGFLASWIHVMPFINTYAYAYGDGSQQPNDLKARIIEHHWDPDTKELRLSFNQPMLRSSFDPHQDLDFNGSGASVSDYRWNGYDQLILQLVHLPTDAHLLRVGPEIWDTHGLGLDQNSNGLAEESNDLYEINFPETSGEGPDFAEWVETQGIPEGSRSDADTPAGDNLPNLLKYATGFEAMTPHVLRDIMAVSENPPADHFSARFYRSKSAVGVRVVPQWSPDLKNDSWTTEGLSEDQLTEEADREAWEVSIPHQTKAFIRLKVERVD
ncbi:MAG: hypothetical protein ACLFU4_01870 [Opitutales bacterium]